MVFSKKRDTTFRTAVDKVRLSDDPNCPLTGDIEFASSANDTLIGNVIAGAFAGNASSINYAMFVSTFDMLVVLFGFAAVFMDLSAAGLIMVVLDVLATIFTFIAGVVLAAKLGVHSCSNHVCCNYFLLVLQTFLLTFRSLTRSQTISPTAPTTQERDVENCKLVLLFTGLPSLDSLYPRSSPV